MTKNYRPSLLLMILAATSAVVFTLFRTVTEEVEGRILQFGLVEESQALLVRVGVAAGGSVALFALVWIAALTNILLLLRGKVDSWLVFGLTLFTIGVIAITAFGFVGYWHFSDPPIVHEFPAK